MYTIVIPVGTNRGLEAAEYVTALPDSDTDVEVVVVNVFEEFEVTGEGGVVRSEDLYDEGDLPKSVEEVVDVLEDHDVDVTVRREHGDPVEEIMGVADEVDANAIAMVGRQRSPTGKALFGSVTQRLILDADCPVTVVTDE